MNQFSLSINIEVARRLIVLSGARLKNENQLAMNFKRTNWTIKQPIIIEEPQSLNVSFIAETSQQEFKVGSFLKTYETVIHYSIYRVLKSDGHKRPPPVDRVF